MNSVKISELKDHLSEHLRAVEAGAEVIVTDRGRPIAKIVPLRKTKGIRWIEPTEKWAEVRDKRYEPLDLGFDIVELLLEDRRRR